MSSLHIIKKEQVSYTVHNHTLNNTKEQTKQTKNILIIIFFFKGRARNGIKSKLNN